MTGKRVNGEGSIFPYRNSYAAYVWVTTPTGQKKRKYVYGKTREEVYDKWVQLKAKAAKVPVPTSTPNAAFIGIFNAGQQTRRPARPGGGAGRAR